MNRGKAMNRGKVHLTDGKLTACGQKIIGPQGTTDSVLVTCMNCLLAIGRSARTGEMLFRGGSTCTR